MTLASEYRQVIGEKHDGPGRERGQTFGAHDARVRLQVAIGEQMVNAARQRIRRVVAPAEVGLEACVERAHGVVARGVDLPLERLALVGELQDVAPREKRQDGRHESLVHRRPFPSRIHWSMTRHPRPE